MSYSYSTIFGTAFAAWFTYQYVQFAVNRWKLRHIPTIGSEGFITSYFSAWKFFFNGNKIVQEGYEKYHGTAFKVPTLTTSNKWLIIMSGSKIVEDVRKATEDQLSFHDVAPELLRSKHLFGKMEKATHDHYHIDTVRGPMTRGFPSRFDEIKDEIMQSFTDLMPATNDWTSYKVLSSVIPVICRTSNRLFVGLPLCRNSEYLRINETLTIHVFTAANILHVLPDFLRPVVGWAISKFPKEFGIVRDLLTPIIKERMDMDAQHGRKWEGRPNDLVSWLLDLAPKGVDIDDLVLHIININFAAIHTTSITLSNTLFDLAPRPEYIAPLRAEIEEVIEEYGWTKEAMGKMRKLDSFIKESARFSTMFTLSMSRKSRQDFTLSNGVVIPAGFRTAIASGPTHLDPEHYDDALTFKGFRFAEMREGGDQMDFLRHQMVTLDNNFIFFGHGRPACPGRFFAVNEVKAMLSYILLNYDIKMTENDATPRHTPWFDGNRTPNPEAQILFRKRQTA